MEPLTPPDCDLRDFPFMPLEVARLRDSELATLETPEACWAAVLLWCAAWHQKPAGSLPDDDRMIASFAGYFSRGKVDKTWATIKKGAMRGWILCDDGRYYHPVVAEKANTAWQSKWTQAWKTECARIKKHNQRHPDDALEYPTIEEFMSSRTAPDCPRDNSQQLKGQGANVPGKQHPTDTETKGILNNSKDTVSQDNNGVVPSPAASVCLAIKQQGILDINPADPLLLALLEAGATLEEFEYAAKLSKIKKFRYVLGTVEGQRKQVADKVLATGAMPAKEASWRKDDNSIVNKARELNIGTAGLDRFQLIARIEAKLEQQGAR